MDENPPAGLQFLRPSREVLPALIRPHIDESMLQEIAEADYGQDAEDHLLALRQILEEGRVFSPMKWIPKEVLELIRWSEPEDPAHQPGSTGIRGYWMRAFVCTALLRAGAEPENQSLFLAENETVVQLVATCLRLGPEMAEACVRFLAWRFGTLPQHEEERAFFALALLILSASLLRREDESGRIDALLELMEEEEARTRELWEGYPNEPEGWLLGLTFHDQCHHVWRGLVREVLLERELPVPPETGARVRLVATKLQMKKESSEGSGT